jgi:5-methylcytosine-specific restriction enzyme subunit McrC
VALDLAELILQASSVEYCLGPVRSSGFLLDMAQVFEDFVCVALREALAVHGGEARLQASHFLDRHERVRMKPDLIWRRHGAVRAVVDAKYKAEKPSGFPDADLYQMLAYCTALGLSRGHLVYAQGNEEARRHVVRNADVEIVCHALDLAVASADLLAQIRSLAASLPPPTT